MVVGRTVGAFWAPEMGRVPCKGVTFILPFCHLFLTAAMQGWGEATAASATWTSRDRGSVGLAFECLFSFSFFSDHTCGMWTLPG